jgi:hypothetical protein
MRRSFSDPDFVVLLLKMQARDKKGLTDIYLREGQNMISL